MIVKNAQRLLLISLAIIFAVEATSPYQTIIFKDGRKRQGTVKEEREDGFEIRTFSGKNVYVLKSQIEKIIDEFDVIIYPKTAAEERKADKNLNVAVMELQGNGVSETDVAGLSNRLRSELFRTGKFSVIERSQMDEVLKEQGFQHTGCTNTECAVEMGQLIGVERIVVGSVDKVGSMYSANIRMVNVATGKIEADVVSDCEDCRLVDVMKETLPSAARKLAGLDQKSSFPPPKPREAPLPPQKISEVEKDKKPDPDSLKNTHLKSIDLSDKQIAETEWEKYGISPEKWLSIQKSGMTPPQWLAKNDSLKSPFAAGFLSLLFPGAGQFYTRKPIQGVLITSATAAAATAFFVHRPAIEWKTTMEIGIMAFDTNWVRDTVTLVVRDSIYSLGNEEISEAVAEIWANSLQGERVNFDTSHAVSVLSSNKYVKLPNTQKPYIIGAIITRTRYLQASRRSFYLRYAITAGSLVGFAFVKSIVDAATWNRGLRERHGLSVFLDNNGMRYRMGLTYAIPSRR